MIVVRLELWSAITHQRTEIARLMIANVGGDETRGDYDGAAYVGRSEAALHKAMLADKPVSRRGKVMAHARLQEHVWNLVAKMLANMGYGR